jgi:hypothetical protein
MQEEREERASLVLDGDLEIEGVEGKDRGEPAHYANLGRIPLTYF